LIRENRQETKAKARATAACTVYISIRARRVQKATTAQIVFAFICLGKADMEELAAQV